MQSNVTIMLVDNGSVKPAATLMLRQLAEKLSNKCGQLVSPASLRHADRINSDKLDGSLALTFTPFLTERLEAGCKKFRLIPLFFSQSGAITSFVPEQINLLERQYGGIDLTVTDVVYPLPEGDSRLVDILFGNIQQSIKESGSGNQNIVLVDHGSPSKEVTAVRQQLASKLQLKFKDVVIDQAVMERREGSEYDFNGPLLEQWLEEKANQGEKSAIVALMFFLPGRHAGVGGDIENICFRIEQRHPNFKIHITPLVGEHAGLIDILFSKAMKAFNS